MRRLFPKGSLPPRPDRRRRPYNRIPARVIQTLRTWEWPALAKVVELHPPEQFSRVADVAGGTGRMARALKDLGYRVTMFEPRVPPKTIPVRRYVRGVWKKGRRKLPHPSLKGICVRRRKFLVRDAERFDLLVGVRPCEASQKLVRAAKYRPLVLMPCTAMCRSVWPNSDPSISNIKRCFRDLGVRVRNDGRDVFWTGESNVYVS